MALLVFENEVAASPALWHALLALCALVSLGFGYKAVVKAGARAPLWRVPSCVIITGHSGASSVSCVASSFGQGSYWASPIHASASCSIAPASGSQRRKLHVSRLLMPVKNQLQNVVAYHRVKAS